MSWFQKRYVSTGRDVSFSAPITLVAAAKILNLILSVIFTDTECILFCTERKKSSPTVIPLFPSALQFPHSNTLTLLESQYYAHPALLLQTYMLVPLGQI